MAMQFEGPDGTWTLALALVQHLIVPLQILGGCVIISRLRHRTLNTEVCMRCERCVALVSRVTVGLGSKNVHLE
jgi:hypothetical protein